MDCCERMLRVIENRAQSALPGTTASQHAAPPVVDIVDALRNSLDAAWSELTDPRGDLHLVISRSARKEDKRRSK